MVRDNDKLPESPGIDGNKSVNLSEELEKANKSTKVTAFPDGEPNKTPIGIRGDIEPEKKG